MRLITIIQIYLSKGHGTIKCILNPRNGLIHSENYFWWYRMMYCTGNVLWGRKYLRMCPWIMRNLGVLKCMCALPATFVLKWWTLINDIHVKSTNAGLYIIHIYKNDTTNTEFNAVMNSIFCGARKMKQWLLTYIIVLYR